MNWLVTAAMVVGGVAGGFYGHDLLTQADFDEFAAACADREHTYMAVHEANEHYLQVCLNTLEQAGATEMYCQRLLRTCQGGNKL
jgi:hypothetical protein